MLSMCGRMVSIAIKKMLREAFPGRPMKELVKEFMDRFNVAPKQHAVTVAVVDGELVVSERRWGLTPSWYKGDQKKAPAHFNAVGETIQEKPSFRSAFKRCRLVVPVSGFYEWPTIAGRKRPMFIHPSEGEHWLFAGLWDTWNAPDGPEETFTVITTTPNRAVEELHHRMPVILAPRDVGAWLDPTASPAALQALLRPCPDEWIDAYEVGPAVGSVKAQGPDLIRPVA